MATFNDCKNLSCHNVLYFTWGNYLNSYPTEAELSRWTTRFAKSADCLWKIADNGLETCYPERTW